MRVKACAAAAVLATAAAGSPARAQEIWAGVYAHDVSDGLSIGNYETGTTQLAFGGISRPLERLARIGRPSVHILAALNTGGGTNYAAAGLSWRLPLTREGRVYLRPGMGVAVHDADIDFPSPYETGLTNTQRQARFRRGRQEIDLGSRVLFEPEVALGFQASPRVAIEASYLHISHGQIFGRQNPGLSDVGVRLVYNLGG